MRVGLHYGRGEAAFRFVAGHWLVKQEPSEYSWADFVKDNGTAWTGVRNHQARRSLERMRAGDAVLFYHSGAEKAVVGEAVVEREAYPDPAAGEAGWVCVDLKPLRPLARPVPLAAVKAEPLLREMALVRQSRLSVMPVSKMEYARLLEMGGLAAGHAAGLDR